MTVTATKASSDTSIAELLNHRKEIDKLSEKPLKAGDVWYMIDIHWFRQWQKYTGKDANNEQTTPGVANMNPGPIDNSGILDRNSITGEFSLKPDLVDELNYTLVPEEAWTKLKNLFGVVQGQPELARHVIESGMFVKQTKVEIYPFEFYVCMCNNEDVKEKLIIGRTKTIENLATEIRKKFSLPDNQKIRYVVKHSDGNNELLPLIDNNLLQDSGLYSGQTLMIDVQNADGSWNFVDQKNNRDTVMVDDPNRASVHRSQFNTPVAPSFGLRLALNAFQLFCFTFEFLFGYYIRNQLSTFDVWRYFANRINSFIRRLYYSQSTVSSSLSEPSFSNYGSFSRKLEAAGLCGLSNLGNTCFMNSALQCMSNTPPLTEYLLSGRYVAEINDTNPLGMRGEMARAYADLIKQLWSTKSGAVIPRNFKTTVGRFAPQFSGYQQQDSQELLAFLLDGLHEDLNRVRKKPYVELKDNDGKSDAEAAAEAWSNYKLRNDSIVVDLFHALLKSTLVCPQCAKVSVTFDPFCYLSLPLPMKKERALMVTFVPLNNEEQITKYRITVPKNGSVKDLAEGLARLINKPVDRFVLAEVYSNRFHKIFYPGDMLTSIMERDEIFAYEIDQFSPEDRTVSLRVYNRLNKKPAYAGYAQSTSLVGMPMIVVIKKDQINYNGLYTAAKKAVSRFVDFPSDEEVWCPNDNENDSGVDDNDDSNNADDSNSRSDQVASTASANDSELFKMVITNAFGTSEFSQLGPGNEISFTDSNDIYLCLEWHPLAEKFLNLEQTIVNHESVSGTKAPKKNIQLSECMDLFTTTEKLGQDDLWFCPSCKVHQQATKKFDLWSVPEILIIHLKRFSYSRFYRDKIEGLVEFPLEGLDVSPWIINEKNTGNLYDLIAVSNHFGGLGGGHYTAYAKNKFTSRWYLFDDSSVSSVDESEVVTKAAYVLVYARRPTTQIELSKMVHIESDPNVEMEDVE